MPFLLMEEESLDFSVHCSIAELVQFVNPSVEVRRDGLFNKSLAGTIAKMNWLKTQAEDGDVTLAIATLHGANPPMDVPYPGKDFVSLLWLHPEHGHGKVFMRNAEHREMLRVGLAENNALSLELRSACIVGSSAQDVADACATFRDSPLSEATEFEAYEKPMIEQTEFWAEDFAKETVIHKFVDTMSEAVRRWEGCATKTKKVAKTTTLVPSTPANKFDYGALKALEVPMSIILAMTFPSSEPRPHMHSHIPIPTPCMEASPWAGPHIGGCWRARAPKAR